MAQDAWSAPSLTGRVAVVTGASRGAGRGIARVLGECGAVVYCAARSSGETAAADRMTGTIEETAREVSERGGTGIPVRCDVTRRADLEALFARVRGDHQGLDILINNAWGGYEGHPNGLPFVPFWQSPLDEMWAGMFERGLRPQMTATQIAIPLMLGRPDGGLIAGTIAWDRDRYIGGCYDVAKHAVARFMYGISLELKNDNIAAVAIAPGFMRTERVLAAFKTDEQNWQDIPFLKQTETPEYLGRAIASLAADPNRCSKSGKTLRAADLAEEYKFTDIDGRWVPPFELPGAYEDMLKR